MSRILLTGATGLIGAQLMRCLGPDNVVYAVSRSARVPSATRVVTVDLGGQWSADQLPRDVETVVHLAQSEHFRDFPSEAEDIFTVNTQSTIKLLDYARRTGVRRFVLASSGGVYGGGPGMLAEDAPVKPGGELGFYIGTRVCSELLSECYANCFDVVCLRFFFVYGPDQRSNMLIPRLVDSIRSGRAITLAGEVGLRLNPIHVEDAAMAVKKALTLHGSHKINVAGPAVLSLREMAEAIGRAVGRAPLFEVDSAIAPRDLVADTERMRRLLCEPRITFSEGIATTLGSAGA
jgi:nucleoside-diphosphate-sugar epimerase